MRMIQFDYKGKTRQALEIGADDRLINCLFCFQVTPSVGHRSFKIPEMRDIVEIDREPFEAQLQDIDETGYMGQKGGGFGPCQKCGSADDLNCDQKCCGCESAVVVFAGVSNAGT